jgi:membrane-bound lytic murein transglycosylase D
MRYVYLFFLIIFLISCAHTTKTQIDNNVVVVDVQPKTKKKKVKIVKDFILESLETPKLEFPEDYFEPHELALNFIGENADSIKYDIPVVINTDVKKFIKVYTKTYPKTFQKWLNRANKYIYIAKDIFRREGLPEDLVVLAFAESGFNPMAYSKAGAGGMWQFMPYTGKLYGLRIDDWIDERRDFEESTLAAAKMLKDLYDYFGDWYLAIAAYNAGAGKVARGIKKYKTKDFFKLSKKYHLKKETKRYVPKFLALLIIYKNYLQYGFEPPVTDPLLYDRVKLNQPINLYVVAKLINNSVDTLRDLNPGLKTPITPPNDGYVLKVPYGTKEIIEKKISQSTPDELLHVKIYHARRGQKLSSIAKKYKVSVKEIKKINGIRYNKLLYSKPIFIPIKKYFDFSIAKDFAKDLNREAPKIYIVKRGDNFYNIAHRHGLSLYDLIKLNPGTNPRRIKPGQAVVVSYDYKRKKKKYYYKKRHKNKKRYKRTYTLTGGKYIVKRGDTLWSIARHFNIPVSVIMAKNNMNSHFIKPGTVLKIN